MSKTSKIVPIVMVDTNKIRRCRWRDEDDSKEKIERAVERIQRQGYRGHLDGILHPDGHIEQLNGHNRLAACKILGLQYMPFDLTPRTLDEYRDIFLSDNLKEDGQDAGWALGAIRKLVPEYIAEGKTQEGAFEIIAKSTRMDLDDVRKMFKSVLPALDNKVLTPKIKRLSPPRDAIEFWQKMQELQRQRAVSMGEQDSIVEQVVASPSPRGKIRTLFCDLLKRVRPPRRTRPQTPAEEAAFSHLQKASDIFRESGDDFSAEGKRCFLKQLDYLNTMRPDSPAPAPTPIEFEEIEIKEIE